MTSRSPAAFVLSGFDPSGGAGFTLDQQVFRRFGLEAVGAITALTVQHARRFERCEWVNALLVDQQLEVLLEVYEPLAIKIGLIPDVPSALCWVERLRRDAPGIPVVWDPVLRPSAGAAIHPESLPGWQELLPSVSLFTPNRQEMERLVPDGHPEDAAAELSVQYGTDVLLKGGHDAEQPGLDRLYRRGGETRIPAYRNPLQPKHGSGCVLSSALAAALVTDSDLAAVVRQAKLFTEDFLASTDGLTGILPDWKLPEPLST